MRVSLGSLAAIGLSVVALSGCGKAGPSQAEAAATPEAVSVRASGCAVPGPQAGCVTIKSRGTVYDISTANVDLARNVGVSITGTAGGETTACGAKLTDVKVEYLTLGCGAPAPPAEAPAQ